MPSHTVRTIKENKEIFRPYDWEKFIEEIDDCDRLGADCDKNTWMELKRFSEEMLK